MTRKRVYLAVRLVAAVVFVLAATVLPHGPLAGLLVVVAGLAAIASSFGTLAGGPGERAGARAQDRYFDSITPRTTDWPPYEVERSAPDQATLRQPPAS